jgi:hypothetical protein
MTVLLALISGAGITATLTASHYRQVIRQLDTHSYDAQWTRDDIAAIDFEKTVAIADKASEHRGRVAAEHVARQVTGLIVNQQHTPIPLAPPRTPVPTYGNQR